MPIQSNIPPKAGRLASGAYSSNQTGKAASAAIVGTVVSAVVPGFDLAVIGSDVFAGRPNTAPLDQTQPASSAPNLPWRKNTLVTAPSESPQSNPNVNQYDLSTQTPAPALTPVAGSQNTQFAVATTAQATRAHGTNDVQIQPNEKGKFWKTKIPSVSKMQFGAGGDKASNTPFHPRKQKVAPRVQPHSSQDGERTDAPSFVSDNNNWYDPNNSFIAGQTNTVGGVTGTGRWHTVKRGAAG
jgi:hypothetical protein